MQIQPLSKLNFNIVDKFVNGECSKCGECCSRFLPLTKNDIKKIKKFIKGKNLKIAPESYSNTFTPYVLNAYCPFLDHSAAEKCQIYPVRPTICREYSCKRHAKNDYKNPHNEIKNAGIYDLYELFNLKKIR